MTHGMVLAVLMEEFPRGARRYDLYLRMTEVMEPLMWGGSKSKAKGGFKGRLALRLYRILARLQDRGLVATDGTDPNLSLFWAVGSEARPSPGARAGGEVAGEPPPLGQAERKKLFLAMMAEDRGTAAAVAEARVDFLVATNKVGWTLEEGFRALGMSSEESSQLVKAHPLLSALPAPPARPSTALPEISSAQGARRSRHAFLDGLARELREDGVPVAALREALRRTRTRAWVRGGLLENEAELRAREELSDYVVPAHL